MNNANFRHSNSCHRSSHMLLQQHVLSGSLTWNGESQRIITALLEMMRYEDHVDSKTVKNILNDSFSEVAPIDAALVANSRGRAKKILVDMER